MNVKRLRISLALPLTLLALVGTVTLLAAWGNDGSPVAYARDNAHTGVRAVVGVSRYVASTGTDAADCTAPASPCRTVQYAVDQAQAGDEIRVAAGDYTDIHSHAVPPGYHDPPASGVITQVLYIDKAVTVRGGYTTANWNTSDPEAHPTTLHAQGQGRGLVIAGVISPTVEGLSLTGGDAEGLDGDWGVDAGGGVYVLSANATLTGNTIYSNTAGSGGGLYLEGSDATLSGNTVHSNVADFGGGLYLEGSGARLSGNTIQNNSSAEDGGGLYLSYSDAALSNNAIYSNTARWNGGGLDLFFSDATLTGNAVYANAADLGGGLELEFSGGATLSGNTVYANTADSQGGGLELEDSNAALSDNTVYSNTANLGGGLYLYSSDATLSGNAVYSNTAPVGSGGLYLEDSNATLISNTIYANTTAGMGGGLALDNSGATLIGNVVYANTAPWGGGGLELEDSNAILSGNTIYGNTASWQGGGLHLAYSDATLSGNTIYSNTIDSYGGGLYLYISDATLEDNTISGNRATSGLGGGLYLHNSNATLSGNTVYANTAALWNGGGLYLNYSAAALSHNTIANNTAGKNGGGLYLYSSDPVLDSNDIISNTAQSSDPTGGGGGLYLDHSGAVVISNRVDRNTAHNDGGGFYLYRSQATLQANQVTSNTAATGGGGYLYDSNDTLLSGNTVISNTAGDGGGLYLYTSDATLRNNVVAGNKATTTGSGIYVSDSAPDLVYTTIADNDDNGLYVTGNSSAPALINTILVSHTVGVEAAAGTATLDGVLWYGNGTNTGGAGTITVIHDLTGTPAFVNPAGRDYHILPTSTAMDNGVAHNYPLDIDGDFRPLAAPPDLGADEVLTTTPVCQARLNGSTVYATVQAAFDASTAPTDLVEVTGVCSGTVAWNGGAYVAVLTKTLTVRGGYSSDFAAWDPNTYPTLLNGLWQGGVLALNGAISPTVEYLTLLGGQAAEGGGLWSDAVNPTLRYLQVNHNVAGPGGGVMLRGVGGRLEYSRVTDNRAADGGGVYLLGSSGTVLSNTVQDNTATGSNGGGGGLYLGSSNATVISNTVSDNAVLGDNGSGGGVYLHSSHTATLSGNTIRGNTVKKDGGGVYLYSSGDVLISGNTVQGNAASQNGGGVHVFASDGITMVNNVVVGNQIGASHAGSGIRVEGSTPVYMLHTTIHDNIGGEGSGVYVTDYSGNYSNVWMTNTLVTSQTVGVSLDGGNTANLNGVLWFGNGSNPGGSVSVTNEHTGDPAFASDGYHLTAGSAAIDVGVNAGVTTDIDGQTRPQDAGYDIGADEYLSRLPVADAGLDQSVLVSETVTLDGSGSRDPDGYEPLTYGWVQIGGPPVILSDPHVVSPTFTAPGAPVVLTFTLAITNAHGLADPTPDTVVVSVEAEKQHILHAGWNLISFNVTPDAGNAITDVLAPIMGELIVAQGFDNGARSYYPGGAQNTLHTMDTEHGYWLKVSSDTTLTIPGTKVTSNTPIPLTAGWNLIGYLPDTPKPLGMALDSITNKYTAVLSFDQGAESWYAALPSSMNTLTTMYPRRGYWIYMTQATDLVYP